MERSSYTLFKTALGVCGIAWNADGVTAFQLPEATLALTASRIAEIASATKAGSIPKEIKSIIKKVQLHLAGKVQDFSDVQVEMERMGAFSRDVYRACREIPAGSTMTYGELAAAMKRPSASRAVGQALGRNPIPLIIPCHRVLASGNSLRGFSAHGGIETKKKLLTLEGAAIGPSPIIKSKQDLARAAAALGKKDPRLKPYLANPIPFRLHPDNSPYETLIEAVVHQQLSPKASATIFGRVKNLFPGAKLPRPDVLVNTPDERLRSAGLSRSKTLALKDIAAKTIDGTLPSLSEIRKLSDQEIIKRLTSIRGVGRWTVEMMLIFNLGRSDVFPIDDYALRKGIAKALKLNGDATPKKLEALGEAWRPYRTVASLYLWHCVEPEAAA